ncbi:MAG TPA: hypothetical protein VH349_11345 [Ktedonobacterales bacterium]|jgi:hypothetical protein
MWNKQLARLATKYPTGVLSVADVGGYPASVRMVARLDTKRRVVTFPALPAYAQDWRGKACLLFHRHNSRLEGLRQMVLKGELVEEGDAVALRVTDFVTANGQTNTDEMPHAERPIQLLQFLLLGRRKAREYERKRGEPWPRIDYAEIERLLREDK